MDETDRSSRAATVALNLCVIAGGLFVAWGATLLDWWEWPLLEGLIDLPDSLPAALPNDDGATLISVFAWLGAAHLALVGAAWALIACTYGDFGFAYGRRWDLALILVAVAGLALTGVAVAADPGSAVPAGVDRGPGGFALVTGWVTIAIAFVAQALLPPPIRYRRVAVGRADGSSLDRGGDARS